MGTQFLEHRRQPLTGHVQLAPIQGADRFAAVIDGPLMLGDVIPQKGHVAASAVLAHGSSSGDLGASIDLRPAV